MVRRAKVESLQKAKKKRKRAKMSTITVKLIADTSRQVQRTVKMENPSSEIGTFRDFQIHRGARTLQHQDSRKTEFAGLIFMCNTSMKQDCFRYRIFGLPEAKKHLVQQIRRGMTLFLFDVDLNSLHGIYKASSPGGFNLQADASRASSKIFPWQVRFTIYKDCAPLAENVFKTAIKDNYDGSRMFRIELTGEQVQKLVKLFQSPQRDAAAAASPGVAPSVPMFGPLIQSDSPPRIIYEHMLPVRYRYLQEQMEKNMHAGSPPRATYEPTFPVQDRHRQGHMEKGMHADPSPRAVYEPAFAIRDKHLQEQMEKNMHSHARPRAVYEPTFPVRDIHVQHAEKNIYADPASRAICEPYFEAKYFRSGCEVRLPRLPLKTPHHNPLIGTLSVPECIPARASFPTHADDPTLGEVEHKTDPWPAVKLRSRYAQQCIPARASFPTRGADPILGEVILHKTDPYPMEPVEVKLRSGYAQECIPARPSFPTHGEDGIIGEVDLHKTDPYPLGPLEVKLRAGYHQECTLGNRVFEVGDRYRHRLQPGPDLQERVLDKMAYKLYPLGTGSSLHTGVSSEGLHERSLDDAYLVDRALMLLSERAHGKELLPESIACKNAVPY